MSEKDRLTRQELSWLLTQEARGAAERLRQGVGVLTKQPPMIQTTERRSSSERPITLGSSDDNEGLESTLDLLDGAMQRLQELSGPTATRGRRGRVDLAALLWEVAPDVKVQLEPGAGTDVFGDAGELRRMLHVLVGAHGQSGVGGAQSVWLRREGNEIKLGVALGPDTAPVTYAERRWLSRMAIRYGGRYELDGSRECLIFPADARKDEVETLRRELEAAKAQGEAYARELAAVFTEDVESAGPPSVLLDARTDPMVFMAATARLADAMADDLRALLGPLGAAKLKAGEGTSELIDEVLQTLGRGAELLALARRMARVAADPGAIPVDLVSLMKDEISAVSVAASSRGVRLTWSHPSQADEGSARLMLGGVTSALRALLAEMLERTLRGSLAGDEVQVAVVGQTLKVTRLAPGPRPALSDGAFSGIAFMQEIARAHHLVLRVGEDWLTLEASVPGSVV